MRDKLPSPGGGFHEFDGKGTRATRRLRRLLRQLRPAPHERPAAHPHRKRIRIAIVVGSALTIVVAVGIWSQRGHRVSTTIPQWEPASGAFLSSPMHETPVTGWRSTSPRWGLTDPTAHLASIDIRRGTRPLVGAIDKNAYFIATTSAAPGPVWWLIAVDTLTGDSLFPAVSLGSGVRSPKCFLNGSEHVLCLRAHDDSSVTASVVDSRTGAVTFEGATDLRTGMGRLEVHQVGMYAVARTQDQGVYGIGPRAETTWFVPGDGSIQVNDLTQFGLPPQEITTQGHRNPRLWSTTVFSVKDGKVLHDGSTESDRLEKTLVYPGGFAAHVDRNDDDLGVQFFDSTGNRVGDSVRDGSLPDGTPGLPIVTSDGEYSVFSVDGRRLFNIPRGALYIVDSTLYVNASGSQAFPEWQQYDLPSGKTGPVCDFAMQNFIGFNDTTMLFAPNMPNSQVLLSAYDKNTCERLWKMPSSGADERVWRVGDTLIRSSGDGTELTSLAAPGEAPPR